MWHALVHTSPPAPDLEFRNLFVPLRRAVPAPEDRKWRGTSALQGRLHLISEQTLPSLQVSRALQEAVDEKLAPGPTAPDGHISRSSARPRSDVPRPPHAKTNSSWGEWGLKIVRHMQLRNTHTHTIHSDGRPDLEP